MDLLKTVYKKFIGVSLRTKLILFSALQIFIPVILIGYFSNRIATHILTDKVSNSTILNLEQSAKSIELFINDIEDLSTFIVSEDSVQKLLKMEEEGDREGTAILDNVYTTLLNLTYSKNYFSMINISKELNGKQFYIGPPVDVDAVPVSEQPWYGKVLQVDGKAVWIDTYKNTFFFSSNPYIFSLARTINDIYNINKRLGVLLINIKEDSLYQFYGSQFSKDSREVYILNEKGVIISHRDKGLISTAVEEGLINKGILKGDKGTFEYNAKGKKQLVTYFRIPKLNWIMVSAVPMDELLSESKTINRVTITVVLVSIVITFFISIFIASTISKPIGNLLGQMKKVSEGDFDIHVDFNYDDEISQLAGGFKSMVKKIEGLLHQVYLDQKKQKEIELKALQAQINPHFLYNTLESINWMAQEINAKEISTMVQSLAKFFRISISKGKDIIDIRDEIEHVKSYLTIQRIRYQEVLKAELDIAEDILNFKIPKLVLQPLVENSIYHGIKKKKLTGKILVTGRREGKDILFEVIDNGVGMAESEIERLNYSLRNPSDEVKLGYGVRNVNERIALRFGREYGLTYHSVKGGGVRVEIRIPARLELED